jgi:bromodomain adjacent to zinc finger domain protein 1A
MCPGSDIADLLLEYSETVDQPAGRLKVRPPLDRSLPFGDQFEKFLMSWSFLNAMGKPLNLSAFNIDDYEQALYHQDPWTSPTPLMVEIHATLLNALIRDIVAGQPPVGPITLTGRSADNDTDYWEGKKGATAETLRPIVEPLAANWNQKFLKVSDQRKGWESALAGCLWERATLDTLPNYLDNILHMTFEDKPAPTRPTWSTGPANVTAANGLIPSKPEKRWFTLHHTSKLDIIAFLIELVAQTASIRDYMEEETAALTENRKEQIEVKRECRRMYVMTYLSAKVMLTSQ